MATVSRVLNAPAQVSQTTRDRVQAAIEALNFMPSPAARAINSGRSRIVGALVPTLDNAIFARFLTALETRLDRFGLSLIVASTHNDPALESARATKMVDIGAEGLVVCGTAHDGSFHALAARAALPVVAVSTFDPNAPQPTVGYDNRAATRLALDHLTGLGHRHIGVLHGPPDTNDRTRARLDTIAQADIDATLIPAEVSIAGGRTAAATLLARDPRPSAVLCFSDILALGVLLEVQAQGLTVPRDLSVMGMENLPAAAAAEPPLTTVRLQVAEMGTRAADALGHWVEDGHRPTPLLLPADLIERATTGPPRS